MTRARQPFAAPREPIGLSAEESTSNGTPEARRMQKRIRKAMAEFAIARVGKDDMMTFSALGTEFVGGLFEMMNRLGYSPTEEQFVAMFSTWAAIVARGEHFAGISRHSGRG